MSRIISKLKSLELVVFDFDGVFTDNAVYVSQDGIESVRCYRSDGLGITKLRNIGVHVEIMSTEVNPVVGVRADKLKIPFTQGVKDKSAAIVDLCEKLEVSTKNTMFVGNDINDIPAFQAVGIPIAVADAYTEVDSYVLFKTQKSGGYGAVREICDLIVKTRNNFVEKYNVEK